MIDPPMTELLSLMICIARLLKVSFHMYLLIFRKFLKHVLLSFFTLIVVSLLELNCYPAKSYQVKVLCL